MSSLRQFSIYLIPFAFLAAMLGVGGCQRKSPSIHFVLPNGYRGAFLIRSDQADGSELQEKAGRYTFIIPESGTLKIQGAGPFYDWHSVSASFVGGEVISVPNEPERLKPDQLALWTDDSAPGGVIYFFVGTRDEHESYRQKTATGPVRLGGVVGKKAD